MAVTTISAIDLANRYIDVLRKNNFPVQEAILFGSYARGNPKEDSDIDLAIISNMFTGNRFEDRRKIVPFRRGIDSRIEPIPFRPDDFKNGGNLIDNIKETGIHL